MFQTFESSSNPAQGLARLTALRAKMVASGVDAYFVPRADAHMGEYVAPRGQPPRTTQSVDGYIRRRAGG